jgi:hypothetical protein
MEHVEVDHLSTFIADLKGSIHAKKGITVEIQGVKNPII